ncbi:hypothetical protein LTR84_003305 [Exophiala bonariae]|uniref:Uncharacterized protein n=1 Tax=Exophiala bonariae TaxID=1690606 RepID=A0AAV9NA96_9EURO|nr:hypothetical protein LTR84_003305 [Exophiala bonariae]
MGAGPTAASGIARVLAHPARGNLAVALLSRSGDAGLAERLSRESNGGVLRAFKTDTSPEQLGKTVPEVQSWAESLEGTGKGKLKLRLAVWNVKNSHRVPFEEESPAAFAESLQVYVTGAMVFAQEVLKWMVGQDLGQDEDGDVQGMRKKGTLVFIGTLGALRTNPKFAAYGAARAGVRMLAQSLAREYSERGVHVVHAIANGSIVDVDTTDEELRKGVQEKGALQKVKNGENIRAESVGRLYLMLEAQSPDLWVHELDMRPAKEKF